MKSMPNLDLLRSLAVILVVVEHTLLATHRHWLGRWNIAWLGVAGVMIFFVHTSLVLMWSLERKPHLLDFYIRRIFRIYPLAVLTILAVVVLHIPSLQTVDGNTFFRMPGIREIFENLLLVQNLHGGSNVWGVMWSLPFELQMYFLLPFLFFFVRQNFVIWPMLLLWALTADYNRTAFLSEQSTFLVSVPYFLSGVIAYIAFRKIIPCLPSLLFPVVVLLMVFCFMLSPSWRTGWFFTLVLALLLPLFTQIQAKWLVRVSHNIAKYSYGIYLSHPISIMLGFNMMSRYSLGWRVAMLLGSLVVIVIPAYHFIELPMIRLGARLATHAEQRYEMMAPVA